MRPQDATDCLARPAAATQIDTHHGYAENDKTATEESTQKNPGENHL